MYSKLRVLLLLSEFPTWRAARSLSYSAQLGIEDGLVANGVRCQTVTSLWLPDVADHLASQSFDQLWVAGRTDLFDQRSLERLSQTVPVRVGLVAESIETTPDEWRISPTLKENRQVMKMRLHYMTHILPCDEKDADIINADGRSRALWWPQSVPERFISENPPPPSRMLGIFGGAAYGIRREWLQRPEVRDVMDHAPSPESGTLRPLKFGALHWRLRRPFRRLFRAKPALLPGYASRLRDIRRASFEAWLQTLQRGSAVVNLPHFVKTYAGRVVEGMAAGRPVVSWEIPDRPNNRALFEHDNEILLYPAGDPNEMISEIKRVSRDRALSARIVNNARRKLRAFHTSEIRVRQILDWIEDGRNPRYF